MEETEDAARAAALEHYGRDEPLRQDEDVLDTWFSSALWPFSTLGWPEETPDLARFYPTHTLVTGFDIIFYWVARMMMMGIHFTGEVPFRRVVFNALVRDAEGVKMSKTKGNVLDPLELIDDYGCDAVRFTLTALSGQARDIRLSRQRIEGYRNFGTKLWNAARFCEVNECRRVEGFDPGAVRQTLNRWIRGEAVKAAAEVTQALSDCAFSEAAGAIYRFVRNVFCDQYVELAKPILNGEDAAAAAETRATAAWTLQICLKLLHPISPFITEALWGEFGEPAEGLLITAPWPDLPQAWNDAEADAEMSWVNGLIDEVRSIRAETNVPPQARVPLVLTSADAVTRQRLAANGALIERIARVSGIELADAAPAAAVLFVIGEATGALAIAQFIDVSGRTQPPDQGDRRPGRRRRPQFAKKLANADFVGRAPEEVVEENRDRLAEAESAKARLEGALERLAGLSLDSAACKSFSSLAG